MKMRIHVMLFLLLGSSLVIAQVDPIDDAGVAIGGYDVVSYFNTGMAIKGNRTHISSLRGVTYFFASAENKKLFESDPARYLPQFDGYCALAVSYGQKISIDPETFKIVNNKLYLFFNGKTNHRIVNSLETWNRNEPKLLKKAEQLWPDVKRKVYEPGKGL